jgi:membrane protease YdiL (CAAX protease family)
MELLRRIFIGPAGLRAGWRLAIFIAVTWVMLRALSRLTGSLLGGIDRDVAWLVGELLTFVAFLAASAIMAHFERRTVGAYGLPWRKTFGLQFWQGAAIGFASITLLLLCLRALGVFDFGTLALRGGAIAQWALVYALVFIIVALKEEFATRGYALFTLISGIGFWPAALLTSAYFGYSHAGNTGENLAGLINAGAIGLLFCFMVLRTGNLWLPIGFHAAWDWGESFFFGVADSGNSVPGHLLAPIASGPAWLSGGSVGPEGSWICTLVIVVVGVAFAALWRETKYPDLGVSARETEPVSP